MLWALLVYLGIPEVVDGGSFLARPLSVDLGEPGPLLGIEGDIVTVVILILQKVPVVRC